MDVDGGAERIKPAKERDKGENERDRLKGRERER